MVDSIQQQLESIYDLRCRLRAKEYLLSAEEAAQLGGTGRSDEELLLADNEEGVELGLYLSEALLSKMNALEQLGTERIWQEALPSFCELAEGVSHFLYVVHSAEHERQVSLLELEAQAEVDKYVLCLMAKPEKSDWAKELVQRLFDNVLYRSNLSTEERHRYEEANRLARRYCVGLTSHVRQGRLERLFHELRYSYRLGREAKLRRFAGTA